MSIYGLIALFGVYSFFAGVTAESSVKNYDHFSDAMSCILSLLRGFLWPVVVVRAIYRICRTGS